MGDNAYKLILPPYMCIYLVVNVKNPKLYEPSILNQENEEKFLPNIEDLSPKSQEKLAEYIAL